MQKYGFVGVSDIEFKPTFVCRERGGDGEKEVGGRWGGGGGGDGRGACVFACTCAHVSFMYLF
jgi:hypothetical protein